MNMKNEWSKTSMEVEEIEKVLGVQGVRPFIKSALTQQQYKVAKKMWWGTGEPLHWQDIFEHIWSKKLSDEHVGQVKEIVCGGNVRELTDWEFARLLFDLKEQKWVLELVRNNTDKSVWMKHAEKEYRMWLEDKLTNFRRGALSCVYLSSDRLEAITQEHQSNSFARLKAVSTDAKTSIYAKSERELQAKWYKKLMPFLFDCWQNRMCGV